MSLKDPRPSCPLPIATTSTARNLLRIYARLKGELLKDKTGEDTLVAADEAQQAMAHIAALMPFLGVNFDPKALRPIRTRPHFGPLNHGDVRAGVLAQLRTHGGWLTYVEIADAILTQNRVELTGGQRKHFLQKLREGTHALMQAGAVERERELKLGENRGLQRWRLSRTMFRPKG